MRRNRVYHFRHAICSSLLLTGLTAVLPAAADHDPEPAQAPPVTSQLASPAPALLQVTGTTNRFNISASHADVLSVLKAIFEQSHQQFVPDTSVNGEVTLVLTGQPFSVVLASICKQAFLRYDIDKNGIYQFKRDDQAVREGFARIRIINAEIVEQLRGLGYQLVPAGQAGQAGQNSALYYFGGTGGAGGGGFGGGQAAGPAGGQDGSALADPKRGAMSRSFGPDSKTDGDTGARDQPLPKSAAPAGAPAFGANQEPLSPYDQLLRDNGLVGIHVSRDQPMSIAEALKRFSRQANVPILIDPQLQGEYPLRFYGNIVKPLPEALNLLLPVMHLEWRYTGGNIFVTESPDFTVFYGISNIPKVVYPPNNLLQQSPIQQRSLSRPSNNAPQDSQRPSKGKSGP